MKVELMRKAFGKKRFKIMPMSKPNGWLIVINLFGLGVIIYR